MQYISYSRLSLLETCGLRFYYEYVLQLPAEDQVLTYYASFGKLVHALYEEHANRGGRLQFVDLKALYDQRFPEIVGEFPERATAILFYKNGVQALFRLSHYEVGDVVASEAEFMLPMGRDIPPVKGFIDRVIHTKEHGYMVADLKTGKAFLGRNRKKLRQLALYSSACEQQYGTPAGSGFFDFIVQGTREWVDITEEDRVEAKNWVVVKWRQIEREEFAPRYSAGFCSAYCPFRTRCPEYARKTQEQLLLS